MTRAGHDLLGRARLPVCAHAAQSELEGAGEGEAGLLRGLLGHRGLTARAEAPVAVAAAPAAPSFDEAALDDED